jgi:hypothetical protein
MDWTAVLTPSLGATGLLAVVVIMILRGSLVPRTTFDTMREDKDKQIDIWKSAYDRAVSVQDVQRDQISVLLDGNRVTAQVIQSIPRAAGMNGGGHSEMAEVEDTQAS